MAIHKEGYKIIFLLFVAVILMIAGVLWFFQIPVWLEFLLYLSGVVFMLLVIVFFRVPVRIADYSNDKIFSGADGKVVVIEEVFEDEYFHDKRIQISVFMSVTNVHVNFLPLSGIVKFYKHHPGKHYFAWLPKSSTDNERTTMVIDNPVCGQVLIRQIAGAFARRIVCYPRQEQVVEQGLEMGIIKFGSRVDVFLPLKAQVKVVVNQVVRGGETVIAVIP